MKKITLAGFALVAMAAFGSPAFATCVTELKSFEEVLAKAANDAKKEAARAKMMQAKSAMEKNEEAACMALLREAQTMMGK